MPQNSLTGGEVDIGGDEAAEFGVIVSALQVIEPGFGWIALCIRSGCPLLDCAFEWLATEDRS